MKRAQKTNAPAKRLTFRRAGIARAKRGRAPQLHGGGAERRIFRSFDESGVRRAKRPGRAGRFIDSPRAPQFDAGASAFRRAHEIDASPQNTRKKEKSFFFGCTPYSTLDK